jgi:hypothetical protein
VASNICQNPTLTTASASAAARATLSSSSRFAASMQWHKLRLKATFKQNWQHFITIYFQELTSRRFQHGFHGFNLHRPTSMRATAARSTCFLRRSSSRAFTSSMEAAGLATAGAAAAAASGAASSASGAPPAAAAAAADTVSAAAASR